MLPEGASRNPGGRREALVRILRECGSTVVALSGGVDSATLATLAHRELGDRSLAVTGVSPALSEHARDLVRDLLARHPMPHEWVETRELASAGYRRNEAERCFFCKHELYRRLRELADRRGFAVVLDGTNADDTGDFRPGRRAASAHGVRSPLLEAGCTKADVRELARDLDVPAAEEPASACLSSRIPHGIEISIL